MAATNIKDLKSNISSTIYNGAPSVTPDMVANSDIDVVDSVNQNTDGVYQYLNSATLTSGKFTMLEVDGSTVTNVYQDAAYFLIHDTDLGGFDYSLLQSASTLLIHLVNNDGTKVTFECSFNTYVSNVLNFNIDTNHYLSPTTITLADTCKVKMIHFDSITPLAFSNGLTKTGNDVKLGGLLTEAVTSIDSHGNIVSIVDGEIGVTESFGFLIDPARTYGTNLNTGFGYLNSNGTEQATVYFNKVGSNTVVGSTLNIDYQDTNLNNRCKITVGETLQFLIDNTTGGYNYVIAFDSNGINITSNLDTYINNSLESTLATKKQTHVQPVTTQSGTYAPVVSDSVIRVTGSSTLNFDGTLFDTGQVFKIYKTSGGAVTVNLTGGDSFSVAGGSGGLTTTSWGGSDTYAYATFRKLGSTWMFESNQA